MFTSIFQEGITVGRVFLMAGLAVLTGFVYSLIASTRVRSSKGFFAAVAVIPLIVSVAICFLDLFIASNTSTMVSRIATFAVALGLIRFRSVNGKADEMVVLLGSVISGLVFGLGYASYSVIFSIAFILLFVLLTMVPLFKNKRFARERLLKITIPESLDYSDMFKTTFEHYLKTYEEVEVKTTGMGSMFKISYKVLLKNDKEEKELIDELRTKNGNLEISMLPYTEPKGEL